MEASQLCVFDPLLREELLHGARIGCVALGLLVGEVQAVELLLLALDGALQLLLHLLQAHEVAPRVAQRGQRDLFLGCYAPAQANSFL